MDYKRPAATRAFPLSVSVLSSQYLFQRGPIWVSNLATWWGRTVYHSLGEIYFSYLLWDLGIWKKCFHHMVGMSACEGSELC